ncbi:MAG: alpha/beta hydrolase [Gammaproteobacteria bacterium]
MRSTRVTSRQSRQNEAGFSAKPAMGVIRFIFPIISPAFPRFAARCCLHIFLTPQRYRIPAREEEYVSTSEQSRVQVAGKSVVVYAWGNGNKKVLLCHSWGGRGTQLAAFIKPFLAKGYAVMAFDAPGHGRSTGRQTDMMEYSATINTLIKIHGPFHAIIGHSFGAGNILFSKKQYAFQVKKIALIGCFSRGSWVTDRFGELLNIPPNIIGRMMRILEEKYNGRLRWDQLDMAEMARAETASILVVHDRDDMEIPYSHALEFEGKCGKKIELFSTDGLGHRRILRNSEVISRVCEFVGEE